MAGKALSGTKILEYSQFVAGPYCTKLMAELGAEVIKIEPPEGDIARKRGPFPQDIPHLEKSGLFLYLNTNKFGVTLNINSPEGQELFKKLVKEADILVEDTPPGIMEKVGLDYKSLSQINPRLIMTSITPFGQTGPYKDYKAYYLNTDYASGLAYLLPFEPLNPEILKVPPVREGGYIAEYDSGTHAAIATMGAAYLQFSTGIGQHIDISKQEALISQQRFEMAAHFEDGQYIHRADKKLLGAWGGVFICKDGYIFLTFGEDHQWRAMVEMMGNPEWSQQDQFTDYNKRRLLSSEEITPYVAPWVKERTRDEIFREATGRHIPCGPLYKIGEVPFAEHIQVRDYFVEVEHPVAGKLGYASGPGKFSQSPRVIDRSAPLLGQHNEEIYIKRLGLTQRELTKLKKNGVL